MSYRITVAGTNFVFQTAGEAGGFVTCLVSIPDRPVSYDFAVSRDNGATWLTF